MIYTVTLNPAIDRELTVPALELDTVLRATGQRVDCGGKGFNVSRMVAQLGGTSVALGFVGGRSGEQLQEMLEARSIATSFVWIDGETRTNVSIVANGHHVKVNEAGAAVSAEKQADFLNQVRELAKQDDWWVLAGSLPPNVPSSFYADLINVLNAAGARVILDASGEPLRLGCEAGPFLVKPNLSEAAQLTGCDDPLEAAAAIQQIGVANVVISLGADGVLLANSAETIQIAAPSIEERNPIGAGDALVGGLAWGLSKGYSLADALRWGIACGSVAASLDGTAFGDYETIADMEKRVRSSLK